MQTVLFQVSRNRGLGRYEARSKKPHLWICATTMEEIHHEARDVLIQELGTSHVAFQIRFALVPFQAEAT